MIEPVAPTTFSDVRRQVLGYCDAALGPTKQRIAEMFQIDASDVDALLADDFNAERCSDCGHWFDKSGCTTYDGHGVYMCVSCSVHEPLGVGE